MFRGQAYFLDKCVAVNCLCGEPSGRHRRVLRRPCFLGAALLGNVVQLVAGNRATKQRVMVGGKIKQCLTNSILPDLAYGERKSEFQITDLSNYRQETATRNEDLLVSKTHLRRAAVLAEPVGGAAASDSTPSGTPIAGCLLPNLECAKAARHISSSAQTAP